MELVKTIVIDDEKVNYNVSAVMIVEYAAKFNKNIFDIFKTFAHISKKTQDEVEIYLMENSSILNDFIEVAYVSINLASREQKTYSEFLAEYSMQSLIKVSAEIIQNIYINNKPINKQKIKAKNTKKK